jgi:deoxycytidylate deaminase
MSLTYAYDWADLAFGSKKPLKELKATFVAAPREMSISRFKKLVKDYLPQGNMVIGFAKETFVDGFEDQPQFRMLQRTLVQTVIDQVNTASPKHKIYTLEYFQRELPHLVEKLNVARVVLVNGSWKHVFHASPTFYMLTAKKIPYDMVSPFTDEHEAKSYEQHINKEIFARLDATGALHPDALYTEAEMLRIAALYAQTSFDYSFQTGTALGMPIPGKSGKSDKYRLMLTTTNKVVPYQTYAMLHGASREKNFSPPHDLNHYDTVHAEVWILIRAQQAEQKVDMRGSTLFINLMPCPSCARMLSQTDIETFVYSIDHSDGYAVQMLEAAGKKVRRVVL